MNPSTSGRATEAALLAESEALHARVRRFARASMERRPSEPFEAIAHDILAFQEQAVRPVARLFRAMGVSARSLELANAPGLPTDAFRVARVAAHEPKLDEVVFQTSGTTSGARGRHPLRTTETYLCVSLAWARRLLYPDAARLRVAILADGSFTDSSLGFMMRAIAREHDGGAWFVAPRSSDPELVRIDVEALSEWAEDARRNDAPALVLGASFAFVHLLDALGGSRALRLPPGSRAMQTGGFKGRSRAVAPDELRARVAEALGTPESHVISEYGMTELSSQGWEPSLAHALGRYEGAVEKHHHALPPWMRVDAVHPERFTPLPLGYEGLGRVIDLANIDSALLVQTADRVVVTNAGVRVLGRDPAAVERGCSLGMDELLSGSAPQVDDHAR